MHGIKTDGILHASRYTLKQILSMWLLEFGMNPVSPEQAAHKGFTTMKERYISWSAAEDAGYLAYTFDGKMQLTQKALDYINDQTTTNHDQP